jgi:indolepyruvate ferredoxin oxidoreductase alpha subunit
MTKFVIDAGVGLRLAAEQTKISPNHDLFAPTLFRSETLAKMHEAVARGDIDADAAQQQLERLWNIKIRYLGDAVLRRQAWRYAEQLGWADTYAAEYVALTKLQGNALVTLDKKLAKAVEGIVPTAPFEALTK